MPFTSVVFSYGEKYFLAISSMCIDYDFRVTSCQVVTSTMEENTDVGSRATGLMEMIIKSDMESALQPLVGNFNWRGSLSCLLIKKKREKITIRKYENLYRNDGKIIIK